MGACIDAVTDATCRRCIDLDLISCVNRNGCQEVWSCYTDCIRERCPGDPSDACVRGSCGAEEDAFDACVTDEVLMICGERYQDCLPE